VRLGLAKPAHVDVATPQIVRCLVKGWCSPTLQETRATFHIGPWHGLPAERRPSSPSTSACSAATPGSPSLLAPPRARLRLLPCPCPPSRCAWRATCSPPPTRSGAPAGCSRPPGRAGSPPSSPVSTEAEPSSPAPVQLALLIGVRPHHDRFRFALSDKGPRPTPIPRRDVDRRSLPWKMPSPPSTTTRTGSSSPVAEPEIMDRGAGPKSFNHKITECSLFIWLFTPWMGSSKNKM
jgi:hypothetical protein